MPMSFSKFYKLTEMAKKCGLELPDGVFADIYSYCNQDSVSYKSENIEIVIKKDDFWQPFFDTYNTYIYVEPPSSPFILVYRDGWVHSVPYEMKKAVRVQIKKIKEMIKVYKKNRVRKTYLNMITVNEREVKNKKIKAYEEEKKTLLNMFRE